MDDRSALAKALFHSDMRLIRRILTATLILFLLPWLFAIVPASFTRYDTPGESEAPGVEPVITGQPVRASAPIWTQYSPLPQAYVEGWLEKHYPGTAVTADWLGQIAQAAKQFNVNELFLLGILNAEQGMLDRNLLLQDGLSHYQWALQNPFDYGVYPGSPFNQDIGVLKSAEGAAQDVAAAINAVSPALWPQLGMSGFFSALSGFYVNGTPDDPDMGWVHNVASVYGSLGQALYDTPSGQSAVAQVLAGARDLLVLVQPVPLPGAGLAQWVQRQALPGVVGVFTWIRSHVEAFLIGVGLSAGAAYVIATIIGALGTAATGAVAAAA